MKKKRSILSYITAFIMAVMCMFAFAGCGSQGGNAGKTLTFAGPDYKTLNSILNTHDELPSLIFSGLMKYDGQNKPVPDLATSYDFDKNTLTYTFHLRKNVTWHDGQPFTADDVKFTLDTLRLNKDIDDEISDNYKEIKAVDVVDPQTVKVELSKPSAAMLDYLTIGILPKHCLEGKDIMTDPFNQKPIGTGRYKFVSWDKGQSIILQKNDKYYGTIPKIDRLIFKIIPDETAKAAQLKSGGADVALLNAKDAATFRNNNHFKVYDCQTADFRAIGPNFKNPYWQNPEHQALIPVLGYALDKKAIIAGVLNGEGEAAYSPIQLNAGYNDPTMDHMDYNPTLFKQRMAALGWKLGSDGIYEKNGEKLSFSVDARDFEEERVDMAKIASAQFKKLGVDMKVNVVPKFNWKTMQCCLIGQATPFDPDAGLYNFFYTGAGANYTDYSNSAVDAALAAGRNSYDVGIRKNAYIQFQKAWSAHPAFIMIAFIHGNYVATNKVTGLTTDRVLGHHAAGIFWNVENWDISE
ncbi:ABC transporter substrate-binding protein [uncultured Megasphaera sp.]|uniref:ABC transporter substrate-binding protein n=1 Tax=uncultured Megasphaera sp. TaxID=165188 RepID=UPI002596633D|nr:ABC transporter substrate-binding protein [uncultured Megasphaera sp.]